MVKPSTPNTESSSDPGNRVSINEKEDLEPALGVQQKDAEGPEIPGLVMNEQVLSKPLMNVSDWNGPDDPDNPHNCVFALLLDVFSYSLLHRVIME
jgi:hypothetical protein